MSCRATLSAMPTIPRLMPELLAELPASLHDLTVVEVYADHDPNADPDVLCTDSAGALWTVRRGALIEGDDVVADVAEIIVERATPDGAPVPNGERHVVRWPAWL